MLRLRSSHNKPQVALLLILVLVSVTIGARSERVFRFDVQTWENIKQSSHLANHPVLRKVVAQWMRSAPGSQIEISYTEGEVGQVQATELQRGLVALGIPSKFLSLHGSNIDMAYMELSIIAAKKP